jgi:hypothetical protein
MQTSATASRCCREIFALDFKGTAPIEQSEAEVIEPDK